MDKKEKLEKLEEEIVKNKNLPLMESNLVFGEGDPDAKVIFIGEAPGENENIQKRPFVGRGGQLLNKLLREIGWRRESVYITNIVKRRPPNNRDPLPEEIEAYKPYLGRQIEIISPKVIATLGRFSMSYFLPTAKISRDQGKLFKKGKLLIYPLFHPAAALRSTNVFDEFQKSFKRLPEIIKRVETSNLKELEQTETTNSSEPQSSLF